MSEFVCIYEYEAGGWGAFLPHLPGVVGGAESRAETEELIREAVVMSLEYERDDPGSFTPIETQNIVGVDAAAIEQHDDGSWLAILDFAPTVRAVGETREQAEYLIAVAASTYRDLLDDDVDVSGSTYEATMLRVPAIAPVG